MKELFITILGVLILLQGSFLLMRIKLMVKSKYIFIFDKLTFILLILLDRIEFTNIDIIEVRQEVSDVLFVAMLLLIIWLIAFIRSRGRYTIYNVNGDMIRTQLIYILEVNNISYKEEKNKIILEDYNEPINYKHSLHTVDIDFTEVRHLSFYQELIEDLKIKISEIDKKVFPTLGLINVMIGVLFIIKI